MIEDKQSWEALPPRAGWVCAVAMADEDPTVEHLQRTQQKQRNYVVSQNSLKIGMLLSGHEKCQKQDWRVMVVLCHHPRKRKTWQEGSYVTHCPGS